MVGSWGRPVAGSTATIDVIESLYAWVFAGDRERTGESRGCDCGS